MRRKGLSRGRAAEGGSPTADTLENYFSGAVESEQDRPSLVARLIYWGGEVRCRENIPLAVMSAISLAILFLFGVAEVAMRDTQRQHDSCSGSRQAAISSELARNASSPAALPPCFPSLPSSRLAGPTG